jgi:uncharacterized ion transporter superfamily protein YfcC
MSIISIKIKQLLAVFMVVMTVVILGGNYSSLSQVSTLDKCEQVKAEVREKARKSAKDNYYSLNNESNSIVDIKKIQTDRRIDNFCSLTTEDLKKIYDDEYNSIGKFTF